jgi:SAM-dependent methyltransferase
MPYRILGGQVTKTTADQAVCRACGQDLTETFVDLGMSPLCENYVPAAALNAMEPFYPLHVWVCSHCLLVQLEEYVAPAAIFSEYAYFSSYSDSWVEHARAFAVAASERLGLGPNHLVVEVASNDGYLLQHFDPLGIPVLGIEPAANVARVAIDKGIPTEVAFMGRGLATRLRADGVRADLLVGNNVLAHVPDLDDFVGGLQLLLAPGGTLCMEFPHVVRLIEERQLDTIYHEHFSYLSLHSVRTILAKHGLVVFDVEQLPTHGGSLRVWVGHGDDAPGVSSSVRRLLAEEQAGGYDTLAPYTSFAAACEDVKWSLVELLIGLRRSGATIAGYGAPGKGNTLLNYCGIRRDLVEYTVDRNPYKQGMFLPGTHIPIHHPDRLAKTRPDYILILPWNLRNEIVAQLDHARSWGARFIVPIPVPMILP